MALEPRRTKPSRRYSVCRSRGALIWGLVCYATIHLAVLYVVQRSPELRDPLFEERVTLLRQRLDAAKGEAPLLVVMIGTSRTGNGFDAGRSQEQLRAELGRPAVVFNCGIAGIGPIAEQIYLKRLLAKGIRPNLVILEVMPIYYVEWDGMPYEIQALDANRINRDELELLESYNVPIEPFRQQWRDIMLNPCGEMRFHLLKDFWPAGLPANAALNWNSGCDAWGYRPVKMAKADTALYEELNAHAFREQGHTFADFRFGKPARQALIDTVAFCRREGIPVLLVNLPEDSRFRSWYSPQSRRHIHDTFAQIAQQQGGTWINAFDWVPDGNFLDGHHLREHGSQLFTDRLTSQHILPSLRSTP